MSKCLVQKKRINVCVYSSQAFYKYPSIYIQVSIQVIFFYLDKYFIKTNNIKVRLDNVEEYQKVVDAEWNILYDKLDRITKSGATVVLSKLPIGDVATQVNVIA